MTLDEYLNMSGYGDLPQRNDGNTDGTATADRQDAQSATQPAAAPTEDDIKRYGYADVYTQWQNNQKAPDYEAMEKRKRNAATLALIGEIAQLGGQMFAAGRGARRFQPIQSNVREHLSAIDKIRDAKLAYQQDAYKGSLDAAYRDLAGRKQEEATRDARKYQEERDKQTHQWQVDLNNNNQAFQEKQRKAQQEYQTAERKAQQEYQTAQRKAQQEWAVQQKVNADGKGQQTRSEGIKAWAYGSDGQTYILGSDINTNMASTLISKHIDELPNDLKESYNSAYDNDTKTRAATAALGHMLSSGKLSGQELRSLGFKPSGKSSSIPYPDARDYRYNTTEDILSKFTLSGRDDTSASGGFARDLTF